MLTEKECENALTELEYSLCELEETKTGVVVNCLFDENLETIKQLIEEHFSNPPLTFEEIESGKPIWDNKNKEWLFVNNALSISSEVKGKSYKKFMKVGYKGRRNFLNVEQSEIDFELNRFYRKEVQE